MRTKTELIWLQVRLWCEQNPDKIAAIKTPDGSFFVTFQNNTLPKGGEIVCAFSTT